MYELLNVVTVVLFEAFASVLKAIIEVLRPFPKHFKTFL